MESCKVEFGGSMIWSLWKSISKDWDSFTQSRTFFGIGSWWGSVGNWFLKSKVHKKKLWLGIGGGGELLFSLFFFLGLLLCLLLFLFLSLFLIRNKKNDIWKGRILRRKVWDLSKKKAYKPWIKISSNFIEISVIG